MQTPKYLVFDTETTVKNKGEDAIGDFAASPFHPDNRIVLVGAKWSHVNYVTSLRPEKHHEEVVPWLICGEASGVVLVGHNIKFDLHYLMHEAIFRNKIMPHIRIWDTQLAEYLLTAQQTKFASLNSLAEKYGGTQKENKIKEFWDNGVETEAIPHDLLKEYCIEDVRNTELIFQKQIAKAAELGMLDLIRTQMEALLATVEMEYNGMAFDALAAREAERTLETELIASKEELTNAMVRSFPREVQPNPDSKDHLSMYLFGGRISYWEYEQQHDEEGNPICYKSGARKGEPKLKKVEKAYVIPRNVLPHPDWTTKKAGIFSTADDVLNEILDRTTHIELTWFITTLIKYRGLAKDVGTYYKGYTKLVWPDGCIHGKINMTSTNTGRTSSSSPNMQNLSGKDYE